MASAERIFKLLDTRPAIAGAGRGLQGAGSAGKVEFQNVWFAYQGED